MEDYTFYFGDYAEGKISLVNYNIGSLKMLVNHSIGELDNVLKDLLIVAISREEVEQVAKQLKSATKRKCMKHVMILGGDRIGFYLGDKLSKKGINVKIVESNLYRCKELTDQLHEKALVIHGNGIDMDFFYKIQYLIPISNVII